MLISKQHLKDQERFYEELVRWYAQSPGDSFGLLKMPWEGEAGLTLEFSSGGSQLKVELSRCHALTPGGHYVEISQAGQNVISATTDTSQPTLPVFLSVKSDAKREVGDPDPKEAVPRMPYLAGNYELHLGGPPQLPESDFFQIAELIVSGNEIRQSEAYYPPCMTLAADTRLQQKANDLRNRLENLLSLSSRAYQAISTAGALSQESSSVQVAFKETMYQMAFAISSLLDEFVVGRNSGHPLKMVTLFKRLFRVFTTLLNLHPGLKDFLNGRFFTKEMNSEIGTFLASVDAFLLSDYNHHDLGGQIKAIDSTMTTLRNMFGFLAQLKKEQLGPQAIATDSLTYRGKTYRVAKFASSRVEQINELTYVVMDFPAPIAVADSVTLIPKDMFSIPEWNNMQVRLGLNEARGLGETDPVDVDATTFGDKVALHPEDMLKSSAVRQITLIFRGTRDMSKLQAMDQTDLLMYYD
jgi:hypothetical protein